MGPAAVGSHKGSRVGWSANFPQGCRPLNCRATRCAKKQGHTCGTLSPSGDVGFGPKALYHPRGDEGLGLIASVTYVHSMPGWGTLRPLLGERVSAMKGMRAATLHLPNLRFGEGRRGRHLRPSCHRSLMRGRRGLFSPGSVGPPFSRRRSVGF